MHQGTNYRYQSWQPVDTHLVAKGIKAPYYGNTAVAAVMGDLTENNVKILNIRLPSPFEAAYATYFNGKLARIAIINMIEYNYITPNASSPPADRPSAIYTFQLPGLTVRGDNDNGGRISIQRLLANGSNAITGITFDGYSYNYELDHGKPVLLRNATRGETVEVNKGGSVRVRVPYSSAAIWNFGDIEEEEDWGRH